MAKDKKDKKRKDKGGKGKKADKEKKGKKGGEPEKLGRKEYDKELERLHGELVHDIGLRIVRGELPFYDVDPGEDYANVNRAHVRDYPSTRRADLLAELHASARELAAALSALDVETWRRDHGVRHKEETVTVESTVKDLIVDYAHHGEQVRALPK